MIISEMQDCKLNELVFSKTTFTCRKQIEEEENRGQWMEPDGSRQNLMEPEKVEGHRLKQMEAYGSRL